MTTKRQLETENGQLREDLARCRCWNRNMGGRAGRHTSRCKNFAKYLKDCGIDWCPPCRAQVALEKEEQK